MLEPLNTPEMKVIDIINQSDKTVFSFELLPPLKGNDASKIYNTIETLIERAVISSYCGVTHGLHSTSIELGPRAMTKLLPAGTIIAFGLA